MVDSRKPALNRHSSTASGYHSHLENEIQLRWEPWTEGACPFRAPTSL